MKGVRSFLAVIAAVAALETVALDARTASAQLNVAEGVCEVRANRNVLATLSRHYAKCLSKCADRVESRSLAAQQCTLSGACAFGLGNPTCRCLDRAIKVAVDHEVAGCLDCPECYADGNCTDDANFKSGGVSTWSESLFFSGSPAVFCDDTSSPDGLTVAEVRCQQSTGKTLAAYSRQAARCYSTCRVDEQAGRTPPGSCDAPILTNPNAQPAARECVERAQVRDALRIDKQCGAAGEERPECYGSTDGLGWVAREQGFIDGQDASYFCAN